MFRGKNYKASIASFDKTNSFEPEEAMKIVVDTAKAKFDETIELHVKLGVDSRHADQQVRGVCVLPNGTGKTVKVLVIAKGEKSRPGTSGRRRLRRRGRYDRKDPERRLVRI